MARGTLVRPASERQVAFMRKLLDTKAVSALALGNAEAALAQGMDARNASGWIDLLLTLPDAPRAGEVTEEGFYLTAEGVVCRVQRSGAGRLYALRLVVHDAGTEDAKGEFVYEGGLVNRLTCDMRLDPAVAAAQGLAMGVCVYCATRLEDPLSCEIGMGPTCCKRHTGMTQRQYRAAQAAPIVPAVVE